MHIGYIFDVPPATEGGEWMHKGKKWIPNEKMLAVFMSTEMIPAMQQGFEVMLTDGGDICTFHAKGMTVIFPTREIFEEQVGKDAPIFRQFNFENEVK